MEPVYLRALKYAAIFTIIIGGLYVANEEVKPRLFPKRFAAVIDDGFYRSGRIHPDILPGILQDHSIDTIVALTYPVDGHPWQMEEARIANELDIDIVRFPLGGNGTGDPESYVGALSRIHRELEDGKKLLLHCAAGTQRTGGVTFMYRTLVLGQDPELAYQEMQKFDFSTHDNPNLLPFLWEITPTVMAHLKQQGIGLSEVPDEYNTFFKKHLAI
ncbi:MAG: hypothetical protein ISP91_07965 [Pseudomonadales bacterium]|nr:hypothetical protein [Pseudomonadales bacterium]